MTAVCKEFLLGGSRPFTQPEMRMLSGSTHEDHSQAQTLLLVWHGSLVNLLWHSCFRVFKEGLSN